jgi:DNA-binding response OmpR family regulator
MNEQELRTILVVEDEAPLRRWMHRSLGECGHVVLEAGNATEAFASVSVSPQPLDLAIVDMILPGISGLDIAVELQRRHPNLPILYTSGCVDSIAMEGIWHQSPEAVLFKPYRAEELIERVQRLTERRNSATQAA